MAGRFNKFPNMAEGNWKSSNVQGQAATGAWRKERELEREPEWGPLPERLELDPDQPVRFVNLTPHAITVCGRTFEPSGQVARVAEQSAPLFEIDGIPVVERWFGRVEGLPEPAFRTWFLVSALVRLSVPRRIDALSPGDAIRDEVGRIIGCSGLVANLPPDE